MVQIVPTVKNSSPPSPAPQLTTIKATNTRISSPLPGCSHDPVTATVDIDATPEKLLENVISPISKTSAKALVKTRGRQLAIILNSSERKQQSAVTSSDSDSESPVLQESDPSVAEEWDENECAGCGENYFETSKNEDWIKGVNCSRWLHSACSKFLRFMPKNKQEKSQTLISFIIFYYAFNIIPLEKNLVLAAHTTHRLQPCDVSFFKPLSSYYNQAADKWLRTNPSQNITQFQVSKILGEAYAKAASVGNAINGFAKCGIWPLDANVFDDSEFVCLPTDQMTSTTTTHPSRDSLIQRPLQPGVSTSPVQENMEPSTSSLQKRKSVAEISPLSVLKRKLRTHASSSTTVITSSPYKDRLEEKQSKTCGKNDAKIGVCQRLFLRVFSVSQRRLNTIAKKVIDRTGVVDRRGGNRRSHKNAEKKSYEGQRIYK
ncbi:hypothetical protein MML48_2g00012220 [Holotrichia oblita]|uniref:Uncharacterized protein n=1 Tax=Holotrichia oblita TaxID=644536 RepID=A0ACB9TJQ2_HOLOL|nr:hypothetical protein MML48_2g00012220 [Holotrichia oblita]